MTVVKTNAKSNGEASKKPLTWSGRTNRLTQQTRTTNQQQEEDTRTWILATTEGHGHDKPRLHARVGEAYQASSHSSLPAWQPGLSSMCVCRSQLLMTAWQWVNGTYYRFFNRRKRPGFLKHGLIWASEWGGSGKQLSVFRPASVFRCQCWWRDEDNKVPIRLAAYLYTSPCPVLSTSILFVVLEILSLVEFSLGGWANTDTLTLTLLYRPSFYLPYDLDISALNLVFLNILKHNLNTS